MVKETKEEGNLIQDVEANRKIPIGLNNFCNLERNKPLRGPKNIQKIIVKALIPDRRAKDPIILFPSKHPLSLRLLPR